MGHAVLDALRPQLFDAPDDRSRGVPRVVRRHERDPDGPAGESFRQEVLRETGGVLNRSSRLSRLAEQLGAAIRMQHPDAVDRDCLRNAVNSFFYRDPQTLPPSAPANQLSSEPHSFSRVFTGGVPRRARRRCSRARAPTGRPTTLASTAGDAARLLVRSVVAAPVVPDYFSQVAAHMVDAGEAGAVQRQVPRPAEERRS